MDSIWAEVDYLDGDGEVASIPWWLEVKAFCYDLMNIEHIRAAL